MSPQHLQCSNGHYYYRIKIPTDLKQYFPSPTLKKSLKTTDIKTARIIGGDDDDVRPIALPVVVGHHGLSSLLSSHYCHKTFSVTVCNS
jgi:hypothetical protein